MNTNSADRSVLLLPGLLGFFSIAVQGLLFREHALAYGGNEVGAALFLAAWVGWGGVGALLASRFLRSYQRWKSALLLMCYAPAALAELVLVWGLRTMAGIGPQDLFPVDSLALWTLAATAPLSLLTGALFVALTQERAGVETRWSVGRVFALEASGAILGGLAVSLGLWFGARSEWLFLGLNLVWVVALLVPLGSLAHRAMYGVHVVLSMGLLLWAALGAPGHLASLRLSVTPLPQSVKVLEDFDTPASHVTFAETTNQKVVFLDGHLSASYPDSDRARLKAALLASTLGSGPKSLLVMGEGQEELVCALSRLPSWTVTWVHPSAHLQKRLDAFLPAPLLECLSAPSVVRNLEEPLQFMRQAGTAFDLMALEFPDPTGSASSRFLTTRFLAACAQRMASGGVLTLDIHLPPADAGSVVSQYVQSVSTTLAAAFPQVVVTAGTSLRFWASHRLDALPLEPQTLLAGFERHKAFFPEFAPEHLLEEVEPNRTLEWQERLTQMGPGLPFDESSPNAYVHHLKSMQRESLLLAWLGLPFDLLVRFALVALAAVWLSWLLWGLGRTGRFKGTVSLLVATAGAVGMVVHLSILLLFQVRSGSLHLHFALLNAAYMTGLAGSGLTLPLWRIPTARRARWLFPLAGTSGLLLAVATVWGVVALPESEPLIVCGAASAVAGFGSGLALLLASASMGSADTAPVTAASRFQALDSAGAVAGALFGGLLWLPMLGPQRVAGLLVLGLILLLTLQAAQWAGWLGGRRPRTLGSRQASPLSPVPDSAHLLTFIVLLSLGGAAFGWLSAARSPKGKAANPVLVNSSVPGTRVLQTGPYARDVSGYGGPMDLTLTLDDKERVLGIRIAQHNETPEYLTGIERYFQSFVGKEAPLVVYGAPGQPNGVEAFTGATFTGKAVAENVRRAGAAMRDQRMASQKAAVAAAVRTQLQSQKAPEPPPNIGPQPHSPLPWTFFPLLATLLAGMVAYALGRHWLRKVVLVAAVGVTGFWLNAQLTLSEVIRWLDLGTGLGNPVLVALLTVALGAAVVAGPVFCGTMCPFGALQDLLGPLGLSWRAPDHVERWLRRIKYVVAAGALAGAWAVGVDKAFRFDPLTFAFSLRWDALAVAILLVVLAGSLVWQRPWCRYFCPLGATLSLTQNLGVLERFWPNRRFSRCHLGVRAEDLDCVRCNRCVSLRQPKARFFSRRLSTAALLIFVAVLSTLGVARLVSSPAAPTSGSAAPATVAPTLPTSAPDAGLAEPSKPAPKGDSPQVSGQSGAGATVRNDTTQHPVQRDVDVTRLRQKIESGEASDKEALFYVPVP